MEQPNTTYPSIPELLSALPENPYRGKRASCALWRFAVVVVQHPVTKKFLAVEETKGRGWWLPAGHVDPGETFEEAALRETIEEAGIAVNLEGILRIEHELVGPVEGRMRVIYFARPRGDPPLKGIPDKESLSARWVTTNELKNMKLRGSELLKWGQYIEAGGIIYPFSIFTREASPASSTSIMRQVDKAS